MIVKLFIIVIFFSTHLFSKEEYPSCLLQDQPKDNNCCLDVDEEPPFYVSDNYDMGDKLQYENLRNIDNPQKKDKYIPRGSIVYSPPEIYNGRTETTYRQPVKVLSTPTDHLEKLAKESKRKFFIEKMEGIYGKKRAEIGDTGYMDKRSLRKISKYLFYVNKSSKVYNSDNGIPLGGKAFKPRMNGKMFVVKTCCDLVRDIDLPEITKRTCYSHHYFDLIDNLGKTVDQIDFSTLMCSGAMKDITTIPLNLQQDMLSYLDVLQSSPEMGDDEEFDNDVFRLRSILSPTKWKSTTAIGEPDIDLIQFPINYKTGKGPFNTRRYKPEGAHEDALLRPSAMCSFLQVAKEFQKHCNGPGCEIQFGNMLHKTSWGPHKDHKSGECIDIYPFRINDDELKGLTWKEKKRYDQDKTKLFMDIAIKAGANDIFFNDPALKKIHADLNEREGILPGTSTWVSKSGKRYFDDWWALRGNPLSDDRLHNDHIHLCFNEKNKRVRKSCKEGVNYNK